MKMLSTELELCSCDICVDVYIYACVFTHSHRHACFFLILKEVRGQFPKVHTWMFRWSDGIEVRHIRSRLDHELSVGKVGVLIRNLGV